MSELQWLVQTYPCTSGVLLGFICATTIILTIIVINLIRMQKKLEGIMLSIQVIRQVFDDD